MKKLIFLMLFIISCSKNDNNNDISLPTDDKIIPVKIIKPDEMLNKSEPIDITSNKYYNSLSSDTIEKLDKEQIDIVKFLEILEKAYAGNKKELLTVASIFQSIGDYEKFNEMLDLGVKYNISELVAIKINNHVNKKEFSSAFKLLNNFDSKNSKEFDYVYFEKASYDINNKDYNSAIKNLIYLYNKGYAQLDIQLAYLYIQINDETKALELFKKSYDRGNKEAGYEIGAYYFNHENYEKALPYLLEQYENKNYKVAKAIGIIYLNYSDIDNAILWLHRAYENGDVTVTEILEKLMKKRGRYETNN